MGLPVIEAGAWPAEDRGGRGKAGANSAFDRGGQAGIDIIACQYQVAPAGPSWRAALELSGAGAKRRAALLDDARWRHRSRGQAEGGGDIAPQRLAQLL